MFRLLCLISWFLLLPFPGFSGNEPFNPATSEPLSVQQDTTDKQVIFNGRAWRNLYPKVIGDQFLFGKEFLPGTVTIEGRAFKNLLLRYDIYNDEILTITDHGIILQLNKEMVNRFSFTYLDKTYDFFRHDPDSVNTTGGFFNVLYDGGVSLYVKHRKEILLLAVENRFDLFQESHRIYLEKDGKMYLLSGKRDLLNTLEDNKKQIRSYIKSGKFTVTKKDPWSFVPVIEYYDSLRH